MNDKNAYRPGPQTSSQTTLAIGLTRLPLVLAIATVFFTAAGIGIDVAKFTIGFNGVYHMYSLFDLDGARVCRRGMHLCPF